ncbi:F-box domain-containing protein [Mycena kentingensis (nom. inval.)]|nr:F-box domain-containing protein [Mycena kentingensis (nom. inval.)]
MIAQAHMQAQAQAHTHLLDLNSDVLLHILSWCTIRSVLRMSQTCTTLHALSRSKSLWMDLLRDLRNRGMLDASALTDCALAPLSTPDLVGEVKSLLTRRAGASREARLPGPLPHPSMIPGYSDIDVAPLPGGEHSVLSFDSGRLEVRRTGDAVEGVDGSPRLVWRRDRSDDGLAHWQNCPTFATDVLYGGEMARLLLFEENTSRSPHPRSSIEVHQIDLSRTRAHTQPFKLDLPNCNLNSPEILDTFGVGVLWSPFETDGYWCSWLVFDWAACAGLVMSWAQVCHLVLVPGYLLVLVAVTPCEHYELRLLSMDTLRKHHLKPLTADAPGPAQDIARWARTRICDITPAATHVITGPAAKRQPYEFSMGDLSAHPDPLDPGVYQIRFEFFAHAPEEGSFLHLRTHMPGDRYSLDANLGGGDPEWGASTWLERERATAVASDVGTAGIV